MKQTREKVLIASALLLVLALAAVAVSAQSDGTAAQTMAPSHHAMMLQHLTTKLNLTADQQATAKQLMQDLHAKMQPLHQAQQQLHTDLKTALAAANPDAATVGRLVIQLHQGQAQLKPLMEEFSQKFEAVLNPDQLATYKQLKASHLNSHQRHSGSDDLATQ
jgi:Spy/CpxP family protein refolding chaperone